MLLIQCVHQTKAYVIFYTRKLVFFDNAYRIHLIQKLQRHILLIKVESLYFFQLLLYILMSIIQKNLQTQLLNRI